MVAAFDQVAGSRVAIVAGGSRGVGRETTNRLAARGYAVVVNYVHDQRSAEETVESVLARRGTAIAIRADVADEGDVERLFSESITAFGGIDVVVHAVPCGVVATPLVDIDDDGLDGLWRTTRATLLVYREAARQLRDGGAIVNLSGSVVGSPQPTHAVQAASAAAIAALSGVVAVELVGRDITVNAVSVELGRPCLPGKIADVVIDLLSDEGRALTGSVLRIDARPEEMPGS
jgi:3-oxoacyl-[acyl-carrier protein] reductase